MSKRLNGIVCTGPCGCGKTSYMDIVYDMLCPRVSEGIIIRDDMGEGIIPWGKKQDGPLGDALRAYSNASGVGKLIPDDVIAQLFTSWYEHATQKNPHAELMLISGLPRSPAQLELLLLFKSVVVVHVNATPDQTREAINRRLKSKPANESRPDDQGGEAVFTQRWNEYTNVTLPAVRSLNGTVLHLRRDTRLTERLRQLLLYLDFRNEQAFGSPVPPHVVEKAKRRLDETSHPIHKVIREIESPSPRTVDMVYA